MSEASLTSERVPPHVGDSQTLASSRRADVGWTRRIAARWQTFESRLAQLSDWFNPILVKETRQALRSWQFTLTFILLLVACWVSTLR